MEGYGPWAVRQLAERARVHLSTARRWLRTGRCPWWLQQLRDAASDLGILAGPAWRGWSLHEDTLRSPEGELFRPSDLRAVRVMRGQIRAYQHTLSFQLQADWIEGRYVKVDVSGAEVAPSRRPFPHDPIARAARRPPPPDPRAAGDRRHAPRGAF
jgi:Phage protein